MSNILKQLRDCKFNSTNEEKLLNHPYIVSATKNEITSEQLKNFICEQYHIQQYDEKSLQRMADRSKEQGLQKCYKFFDLLVGGERYARPLILKMAASLGLSEEDMKSYNCKMMAQAYPSLLSRSATYEPVSYVVAACAVNFPAWGRMCGRLRDALISSKQCKDEDLEFLKFFATPIDGFDKMAEECLIEEGTIFNRDLTSLVRLIQEGEVLFWDSVYKTKNDY